MKTTSLITGAGLGAGLMYLFDPERGDRRRTGLGERISSAAGSAVELVESVAREADLAGRARAVTGEARAMAGDAREMAVDRARGVSDRAREVSDRAREVSDRARALGERAGSPFWRLGGDLRDVARDPRSFRPRLENGRLRLRRRPTGVETILDNAWLILGVIAGAAAAAWMIQRSMAAAREIHVRRGITIEAPIDRVWEFWSRFENFPRFMSHVREVRSMGGERSHWVVDGPAGTPVEWDAVTTVMRPHEMIAWRTVQGALVEHSGTVRFTRLGENATHVEVALGYRPLGGSLGHDVATIFGADPESQIDEDLRRLKSQLEGQEIAGANGRTSEWR
ncbi:MAG TPA: SRPBCC family protein [Methylomirabilota bacterium]|jgi:uncharacterized membrane protein|nr:SRPBCC family protein [Methylomirabilota bacterium]